MAHKVRGPFYWILALRMPLVLPYQIQAHLIKGVGKSLPWMLALHQSPTALEAGKRWNYP
jgi:hypothetical protein